MSDIKSSSRLALDALMAAGRELAARGIKRVECVACGEWYDPAGICDGCDFEQLACASAFDLGQMEAQRDAWESAAVKLEEALIRNFGWLNLGAVTPGAGMCFQPEWCIPGYEPGAEEDVKPPAEHHACCEIARRAHDAFEATRLRFWSAP